MPPAGAHRLPHRQLFHSIAGADQKQVDQIHAAYKKEKQRARLQQEESWANGSHMVGVKWRHDRMKSRRCNFFGPRKLRSVRRIVSVDLGLCLRQSYPRFKPRNLHYRIAVPGIQIVLSILRREWEIYPGA